ncbi:MAG: hypothetical protein J0M04_22155 [Verrucomicrobia bacterium]|nr:hypothetical protein [Verrucomicrobiota bacterium]
MNEDQFVPLNRTFREVSKEEIESDTLDGKYDWELWGEQSQTGWRDLEQRFRTVILAEGGAGKTREMKERGLALRKDGKNAWFVELEMLADESVEQLLDREEHLLAFTAWRDSSREPAWFFLDAVDELKLKDGDFRRALNGLRHSIGAARDRARLIVSCRPSDWGKIDIGYFLDQLPAPKVQERVSVSDRTELLSTTSEERFLAPLRSNPRMSSNAESEDLGGGVSAQPEELKVFLFRTLTRAQIEQFARTRAPDIAHEFLKAVESHDRWAFARQPQDLLELLALWRDKRSLGTYKEQLESFLVASLRERDGRPGESSQLSLQSAREGAERLSLSLALSKKRTLLNVSEDTSVSATLASASIRRLVCI